MKSPDNCVNSNKNVEFVNVVVPRMALVNIIANEIEGTMA